MRLDDRAADRQTEPDTRRRRLALAACELLEQRLFAAGGQAEPVVGDGDEKVRRDHARGDRHRAALGRVLGRVLEQVAEHALDQHRIDVDQRQTGRELGAQLVADQCRADRLQRRADDLLDRLPSALELDRAALQPRHVEQVVDHRIHAPRLGADRACHRQRLGQQRRRAARQRVGQPVECGQWRAQIVRQRRQQRVAQALGFDLHRGVLRDLDVVHPLQRDRRQHREGLQLLALLRHQQKARLLRLQGQHAARAHRCLQRQVEPGAAGQGVGAQAGDLVVVERPLGGADVERALVRGRARHLQPLLQVEQEHMGAAMEFAPDRAFGDLDALLGHQHARQIACHLEQCARARLAVRRDARLKAQPGRELPGDQADRKHHREGQQVLHIADRERQARRNEKVVERRDVQERRQHGRPAPEANRHADHREQEHHHDVRQIEDRCERRRDQRGRAAHRSRPKVAHATARCELAARLVGRVVRQRCP